MYQNVGFSQFCDSFSDSYKDNFSFAGKRALYDYLEEYEREAGEDIELDAIALCCDYTEYKDMTELQQDYPEIESMSDLQDNTTVLEFDSGIIVQAF